MNTILRFGVCEDEGTGWKINRMIEKWCWRI